LLEATNDITIDPGVSLNFTPFGDSITFKADADGNNVGSFSMDTTESIIAKGRSVTITGASVTLGRLDTSTNDDGSKPGGDINITATNGSVSAENLRSSSVPSFSDPGKGGDITVYASDRIDVTEAIQADSQVPRGAGTVARDGGTVRLTAGNGISVRDIIDSRSQINRDGVATGDAGDIILFTTNGDITTGLLFLPAIVNAANGNAGKGGNLSINAPNGNIIVTTPNEGIVTRSEAGSNFGNSSNAGGVALYPPLVLAAMAVRLPSMLAVVTSSSAGVTSTRVLQLVLGERSPSRLPMTLPLGLSTLALPVAVGERSPSEAIQEQLPPANSTHQEPSTVGKSKLKLAPRLQLNKSTPVEL
jgi:hypothetical protein